MVMKFWPALLLCSISAHAAEVTLSPKDVAERVLAESRQAREINLTAESQRFDLAQVRSALDYTLTVNSGFNSTKKDNPSNPNTLAKQDSLLTTVSLRKAFVTGTHVALDYSRNSFKNEFPTDTTSNAYPQATQDVVLLTVEQNLLNNYFGYVSRREQSAAEKIYRAETLLRANQLQDLVLSAIKLYWQAYVAQENFRESLNSRDRYQKLVDSARRKTSYGYSNPGELPQIQAEFELKDQDVKILSVAYLQALDQLVTLLKLPVNTTIKFDVPANVPELPEQSSVEASQLRPLRSSRLKAEAAQELAEASQNASYPDLSFVGKMGSSGLDASAEGSYSQMTSGTKPEYYVGLKFEYRFGSNFQNETALRRKLNAELSASQYERANAELQDKLTNARREAQAAYARVLSTRNQRALREKASAELNRSYIQGRTDISILIDALNKYYDSEIALSRAVGDYQIALNQWAAYRDELIPNVEHSEVELK